MSQTTPDPTDYASFIGRYPEFSGIPQAAVEDQLEFSAMTLAPAAWGKWWLRACWLFTAHYLAVRFNISAALFANGMRSPTASIGTVTSKSANTSGISEGSVTSGLVTSDNAIDADFGRTEYGLQYLSLLDMVIPPGHVVFSPSAAAVAGRSRF